ncbi:zinc ribbon domain-containing protein [Galbitalea soli]|uniref:FHA domain-containing protein n=1 Tax=Galbitalea soli TaxID=1268042 RepID=A0A7C9TPB8_9MICO|nr:hypothetical protein [Galbitalea soli]NEM90435.1 hypothetical protein [Galbitalea soli]NYJ31147.1 hypothetical protein [Galbitalea soli]
MNCEVCGTALPEGAMFCGECGRAVSARTISIQAGSDETADAPPALSRSVPSSPAPSVPSPPVLEVPSPPRPAVAAPAVMPHPPEGAPIAPPALKPPSVLGDSAPFPLSSPPSPGDTRAIDPLPRPNSQLIAGAKPAVLRWGEDEPGAPTPVDVPEHRDPLPPLDSLVSPFAAAPAPSAFAPPVVDEPVGHTAPRLEHSDGGTGPVGDIEQTLIVPRREQGERFILQFSTGESISVFGSGLIGRNPTPQPGEYYDHLVVIRDPGKSVSKTHLEFGQEAGSFWVSDRYSGNGSVLREPGAAPRRLAAGRRYRIVRGTRVDIAEQFFIIS